MVVLPCCFFHPNLFLNQSELVSASSSKSGQMTQGIPIEQTRPEELPTPQQKYHHMSCQSSWMANSSQTVPFHGHVGNQGVVCGNARSPASPVMEGRPIDSRWAVNAQMRGGMHTPSPARPSALKGNPVGQTRPLVAFGNSTRCNCFQYFPMEDGCDVILAHLTHQTIIEEV